MRFTRLSLRNWRNFREVDIDLPERVFLVGPNASGKSNFLDVFRFLRDVAGKGLAYAVDEERGGLSGIRSLHARQNPNVEIDVSIVDASGEPWSYRLAFGRSSLTAAPVVVDERVSRGSIEVMPRRPDADDLRDPQRLTQTNLEQVNANVAFRSVADLFRSVRYLHLVPQLVREPDRWRARRGDAYGGDFLEVLAATPKRTREARLRKIENALRIAIPHLSNLELKPDSKGAPHLEGLFEHWRPNAGRQTERDLSDGTLRLLGLLWSMLDGDAPLLMEEPELSLNVAIVRQIPGMLWSLGRRSGRQTIMSTHSADLLRDEGIGLDEVLLVRPGKDGSTIEAARSVSVVRDLVESGIPLSEAVVAEVEPKRTDQLLLAFAANGRGGG